MGLGLSIHIGLNRVDPAAYQGWDGQLAGCLNDANAMHDVALANGFSPSMLLDDAATSDAVIQEIGAAALRLGEGDVCLITYSGHGGQVPDTNGDEYDGKDETWVLFDRMLVDDELYQLWSQFLPGVRIVVVSDSCHSGTVLRMIPKADWAAMSQPPAKRARNSAPRPRIIPDDVLHTHYQAMSKVYKTRQMAAARGDRVTVDASVLLLSGCQDNQLSADGATNGLFTETLLDVWGSGQFSGDYRSFLAEIQSRMPPAQTPNLDTTGRSDPDFLAMRPFSLSRSAAGAHTATPGTNGAAGTPSGPPPGRPIITGPTQWSRDGGPPTFAVSPAPNTYYAVELATDRALFNLAVNEGRRTAQNFYGSWQDTARQTAPAYTVPPGVWARLKAADRLYYRAVTTAGPTGWTNYHKSTEDDADDAPSVALAAGAGAGDGPPPARGVKDYPRTRCGPVSGS